MPVTDILIGETSDPLAQDGDSLTFDTGWSLMELRVGDPPVLLQLTDQDGAPLPATPPAFITIPLPGYVACPRSVANGLLSIYALGQGVSTVTVTYEDPVTGRVTKDFEFTAIDSFDPPEEDSGLTWEPYELAWGEGEPLAWE